MPRLATGAKTAERAPTATRRSPRRSSRQASARSPSESALCSTATSSPKAPRNRLTVWGVRPISGTSTMAPRPAASTRRTASRYTRVFPLPVTPNKSAPSPAPRPAMVARARGLGRSQVGGRRCRGGAGEGIAQPLGVRQLGQAIAGQPAEDAVQRSRAAPRGVAWRRCHREFPMSHIAAAAWGAVERADPAPAAWGALPSARAPARSVAPHRCPAAALSGSRLEPEPAAR